MPGTLAQYVEFEAYEEGSGLTASAPYNRSELLIVYIPGLYDELPVEEITELSAETETVTINGIEFFHVSEVYDDSPYIYEGYIGIDENIVIMFSTEKAKADSPFAEDIASVIQSVHK